MKRFISLAAAAAMIFGAVSCQKETSFGQKGDSVVKFNVVIPDEVTTKAISDGLTVDELVWEVYDHDNNKELYDGTVTKSAIVDGKRQFVLELNLVSNLKYDILFWAQKSGQNHYDTDDLKHVEAYYNNEQYYNHGYSSDCNAPSPANDETRDAFYGSLKNYQTGGNVATEQTVTLKRPFAQINFASSPTDWKRAKPFINNDENGVAHHGLKSQITISNMYTTFNVYEGDVFGEANKTITFEYTLAPASKDGDSYNDNDPDNWITYEGAKYGWAAMNYVFAPVNGATSNSLVAEFVHSKNAPGESALKKIIENVPFKQNYRTNILGEIFTGGNKFTVIVDGSFNQPDPGYTIADPLLVAFENGGNILLTEDVELSSALILNNKNLTLDLNGHTITPSKDFWNVENKVWSVMSVQGGATLTIKDSKGTGAIVALQNDTYGIDVRDGSTLNIEGGKVVGNISAVYVKEGTANIKGGHYSIMQLSEPANGGDERFTLNCVDANYKAGTAKINVTGGSFVNFNPANNLAEGANTRFVPDEGYVVSDVTGTDGKVTYTVTAE